MNVKNVKIVNISENLRFPGVIYAELIEVDPEGQMVISGNLSHILNTLRELPEYNCINASIDSFGNFVIHKHEYKSKKMMCAVDRE